MADAFWIKNPSILFANGNYLKVWPQSGMTTNEILNTLTRIIIYLTIIYLLLSCNYNCLYVPLISLILIIVFYLLVSNRKKESFTEADNKTDNKTDDKKIKSSLKKNRKSDGDEIIEYSESMPELEEVGKNPNSGDDLSYSDIWDSKSDLASPDQSDFAHWVYHSPAQTCKENTAFCSLYEDVRFTSS